mmetsp:Transcript_24922/g.63185  ORF Transcript_24922/g.63185 Transcript_24922/m.63185 type:complete len:216 (-) Transcript_24922:1581-2228(-)
MMLSIGTSIWFENSTAQSLNASTIMGRSPKASLLIVGEQNVKYDKTSSVSSRNSEASESMSLHTNGNNSACRGGNTSGCAETASNIVAIVRITLIAANIASSSSSPSAYIRPKASTRVLTTLNAYGSISSANFSMRASSALTTSSWPMSLINPNSSSISSGTLSRSSGRACSITIKCCSAMAACTRTGSSGSRKQATRAPLECTKCASSANLNER